MPRSRHQISARVTGIDLVLETSPEMFSPRYVDSGTLAMLSVVEFSASDKVLDLGCGYGVVGIVAARLIGPERVFMIDHDPQAIDLSRRNADRNGVAAVRIVLSSGLDGLEEAGFTKILTNPPYHEDFSVPKRLIQKAFNRLLLGGQMFMVTKRRTWYEKKLQSIFGSVRVQEIAGYFVFAATKRSFTWAKVEARKTGKPLTGRHRPP